MPDMVYQVATWLVPLVIAIVFHEVAHGYVARLFGDDTASRLGRLTLNPLKHVDPIGTVVLPTMLAVTGAPIFGWAKPVPVDKWRLRNPRWHMVLVALAGPGINIALAILTLLAMAGMLATMGNSADPTSAFIWRNLSNFAVINVMLAMFNLLPLPPFDGSHVVEGLLPRPLAAKWAAFSRYGMLLVIILFVAVPLVFPSQNFIARLIGPPVQWVLGLASTFLAMAAGQG